MSDYDVLYKVILVGDPGAGASDLFKKVVPMFHEEYKMTIGTEFGLKMLDIAGRRVKLQIWDTGAEERFSYVRPLYYRGAKGCIYLFDVTNWESYDNLKKWQKEVEKEVGQITSVIAATNINSPERVVSLEDAEAMASKICHPYMPQESVLEVSFKDNYNVEKIFTNLCWFMLYEDGLLPPEQPVVAPERTPVTTPSPDFIAQLPDRGEIKPQEPPAVEKTSDLLLFMSYATLDSEKFQIKTVSDRLTEFPEIKDVLYWEEDADGSIIQYMNRNVPACDIFLLFCSQNALDSEPMLMEWETALIFKKEIIPIFEDINHVPPILRRLRGIKMHSGDISSVISQIHQLILKKID